MKTHIEFGSEAWWDHFILETASMKKTVVLKNVLTPVVNEYRNYILDTFVNLAKRKWEDRCRIYVENLIDVGTNDIIRSSPPLPGEDLVDWSTRAFKGKRFAIILNNAQNYSDALAKQIHHLLRPLVEKLGIPHGGFDVTFFIGNYKYTPLGFHKDPEGHKVMHLHLGPGNKDMHLIDPELYEGELANITFKNNSFNGFTEYDKIMHHSTKYVIKEGDVYFMPWGIYHVGKSEELSASITVWHMDPSVRDMQRKLNNNLIEKIFKTGIDDLIETNPTGFGADRILRALKPTMELDEEYQNISIGDAIPNLVGDYLMQLKSNGYFGAASIPTADELPIRETTRISGNEPFPIVYKVVKQEQIAVFVRGNRILLPYHPFLPKFIDQLNAWVPLKLDEAIQPLALDWEMDSIYDLIQTLHSYKGIVEIK